MEPTGDEADGKDLYDYVRGLKPDIIINNRVGKGREGMRGMSSDQTSPATSARPSRRSRRPASRRRLGSCMTMNDTWGFKRTTTTGSRSTTLIRNLVDIAVKGGNYLLNVGPTAEGEIPAAERRASGGDRQWMKVNGDGDLRHHGQPVHGAAATSAARRGRAGKLYLHVFDWPADGKLHLTPEMARQLGGAPRPGPTAWRSPTRRCPWPATTTGSQSMPVRRLRTRPPRSWSSSCAKSLSRVSVTDIPGAGCPDRNMSAKLGSRH